MAVMAVEGSFGLLGGFMSDEWYGLVGLSDGFEDWWS